MSRVYNFSAGPAVMPLPVLERLAAEMLDYEGSGVSVLEMSHRSQEFVAIRDDAEERLRRLLAVPDDYAVLFLQGGATAQFAAVPLNLAASSIEVAYVDSGAWAQKAIKEARRYAAVEVAWSGQEQSYLTLPEPSELDVDDEAAYLHLTSNETIGGVQFSDFPDHPCLIADMSSDILSRPVDVSRFGLVYAGAQKNIGPAGLALVIVRRDLLGQAASATPTVLDYTAQDRERSLLNTPPTFAIYAAGLVFAWLEELGGLAAVAAQNAAKAGLLYEALDGEFYLSPVDPRFRSQMNVPFRIKDQDLEPVFLAAARRAGLLELKGHRSVGGMRASIYNAMPITGVQALIDFMAEFRRDHD